jgi:hypothetical protein
MNRQQLGALRFFSLLFLLPGLAGLIYSAMVSTSYLERLPRMPQPTELRMTPRNIHGIVVYQTQDEDQRLTVMEDTSIVVFLVGLALGLVYLRKWGIAHALGADDEELAEQSAP